MKNNNILIDVKNLKMYFPVVEGIIRKKEIGKVKAVDVVSFYIKKGETLGLVGETGCGKTTTGLCILQLHRATAGKVIFESKDLCQL